MRDVINEDFDSLTPDAVRELLVYVQRPCCHHDGGPVAKGNDGCYGHVRGTGPIVAR